MPSNKFIKVDENEELPSKAEQPGDRHPQLKPSCDHRGKQADGTALVWRTEARGSRWAEQELLIFNSKTALSITASPQSC